MLMLRGGNSAAERLVRCPHMAGGLATELNPCVPPEFVLSDETLLLTHYFVLLEIVFVHINMNVEKVSLIS